jgi:CheY-like chemotaxis protein
VSDCILIVDDNPINLKLARSVLEIEGYQVDAAIDAEGALGYLEKTSPDLILMDIALPGMDGLSLTRKLKADPRWRSIPVIALTAFAMVTDEKQALDAGCDGYLTKPIDTRQLPLTVLTHLRGSRDR